MVAEYSNRSTERGWKHRFAQVLYEVFCSSGIDRAAALDDAYAHADAQYLVRRLESPEEEARSALTWIQAHLAPEADDDTDSGTQTANPNNGAHHSDMTLINLLGPNSLE